MELERSIISYSLVCLWSKPVETIPILEKEFCRGLFDDPYNTEHGVSNGGFVVALSEGKNPTPLFRINPLRIQFLHYSLDEMLDVANKVVHKLDETTQSNFPFNIKALGVNTEHELTGLDKNAADYLANEYLKPKINKHETDPFFVKTKTIDFHLISNDNSQYGVKLEPRANKNRAIFCSINDHREVELNEFPSTENVKNLFEDSVDKLYTEIFNRII